MSAAPVQPMTLEVSGPEGVFVIRADRGGRPSQRFVRSASKSAFWTVVNLLRGDMAWGTVRVRRRSCDPLGPDVHTHVVRTKDDLAAATAAAVDLVRDGRVSTTG